jgi:putative addiction module killer protein
MPTLKRTRVFSEWLLALRDARAKDRIAARLRRLADGNAGQVRSVGEGVSELKIDYGPGYRVYFTRRDFEIALLLCGGDKSSQSKDIETAKMLAREYREAKDGS